MNKIKSVIKTFVRDFQGFIHPWEKYKLHDDPNGNKLMISNDGESEACCIVLSALQEFTNYIKETVTN